MSQHREVFEEFVEDVKRELGDSLKQLYLYGSVARGEVAEESDIDVFAVVETEGQKRWLQIKAVRKGVQSGIPMSPLLELRRS